MKIRQWLGYNEDASHYLLRPGELRVLNNLQSRRPGMLIARKGLSKVYGQYSDNPIYGIYRRATVLGDPSDFLWLQKVLLPRTLTADEIDANEWPFHYRWQVSRILGNQSRALDILDARGDAVSNFCVAEDRHGRMFWFYGHDIRPRIYRPSALSNAIRRMGVIAPTSKPVITPSGTGFFIENVTVNSGGGAYYAPPTISVSGGDPSRGAILKAIVQEGNVVGIDIVDGGANYQTPPTITASFDKIGTGFRGRGLISTGAKTLEGFRPGDNPIETDGPAATSAETYGTTNGTENNYIMYRGASKVATERVQSVASALSGSTPVSVVTLNSVAGIVVGGPVTISPWVSPFPKGGADWLSYYDGTNGSVLVSAVNATNKTVTLNRQFTPIANTTHELTFWVNDTVAKAPAEYDATRRRFTATIPLRSNSSGGSGAAATLEFSPTPLGYALNPGATSSIVVTRQNWNQYQVKNNWLDILYEEYWEGSDYDKQGSVQNARYIGLQASGASYVRGYTGSVGNKRADVFWPDYSKISVWVCNGAYTSNKNQWTRIDVPVTTVDGAKVIEFDVPVAKKSATVQYGGKKTKKTTYSDYRQLPGATPPRVRLYLRDCPDSWVTSNDQCLPTSVKEEQPNRQQWWSPSAGVPRPIVDIIPAGSTPSDDLYRDAVSIVSPGSGWENGSIFSFRLYRANPYDQYNDYNTATIESSVERGHPAGLQYIEYKFTANMPDPANTPHGPPSVLIEPPTISIPGDGYRTGERANVRLLKRALANESTTIVSSLTIDWAATQLDTLSQANVNCVTSIEVLSEGRNYYSTPTISVRGGGTGYGLKVLPKVSGGRITACTVLDQGRDYTERPELYTEARRAELSPVMRPAMRGKYKCAYRYADMSETVIATVSATISATRTVLTISSLANAALIKPDMILESTALPHWTRVMSVNGDQVEINQEASVLPANTVITIKVRDLTKPISYSDLSPLADVDAGPNAERTHCAALNWSIPGAVPPDRADKVELWRTSADQSLVYYRLEAYGKPTPNGIEIVGTDTLTDEELFDPDRPHYAAMPIVLPNGNVNAYRFGVPRDDMAVGVAFQDRLWMGVSTSGEGVNTLYYSEYDEFESMPDVNELPIQINQKHTDVLTALVPFGSMLLAMQHTHTYAVAYNTDPAIDGTIQMMSHRGCLHQRCWDIHENVLYAADESGIYSMSRSGEVQDISLPIRDYFVSEALDFSKRETFFLQIDPRTHILRFFCCLKSNSESTPSIALCYDIMAKSWWTESYPNSITSACTGRPSDARINTILVGCVDGNMYELSGDSDHANRSLTDCFVTSGGSGYREAPVITVPNCKGASVKGVVSEGQLVDIVIHHAGWEATWGVGLLAQDGKQLAGHDGTDIRCVEYDAIPLEIGPPEPGGKTAVAYANYSVTPTIRRQSTVSIGQDYVRLTPARLTAFEPDSATFLSTETGALIVWTDDVPTPNFHGGEIELQPLPVEVGMQAVGDYIPLNAFVSRIDRNNVHLVHPDGTPVSLLAGAPRTNATGTSPEWLENGGTEMLATFYKPLRTHVPFRLTTGFMQLVNEDNTKRGDSLIDRSVTVVYTPTEGDKAIELIERFNGRDEMRANAMRRDRGGPGGFIHRQDSASTVLNTSKRASSLGFATGVAKATFASRATADMTGEDQHLQVELYARPEQASPWQRLNFWNPNASIKAAQPCVLHSLTINGVADEDAQ